MNAEIFRQKRSVQKHAAILEAARATFMEVGYERAVMEAIARRAGVSTATLYRHFTSKGDLFEAVAGDAIEAFEGAPPEGGAALDRLEKLAHAYAHQLSTPHIRALVRMLVAETGRNPDLADRFYDAVKTRLSEAFGSVVMEAYSAGYLKAIDDPGHAAGQLQGMIEHSTLMRGLILGDTAPPPHPAEEIAEDAFKTWMARWGAER